MDARKTSTDHILAAIRDLKEETACDCSQMQIELDTEVAKRKKAEEHATNLKKAAKDTAKTHKRKARVDMVGSQCL